MSSTSAFVKKLASNDRKTRNAALEALRRYLSSKTIKPESLSLLEMEKLWRGLYFSMWFCDKAKAQERLAESLGRIYSDCIKSPQAFLQFVRAFNLIMIKEWSSIDQWRIDKYYLLIRRILRHNFRYLKSSGWDSDLVSKWTAVLSETILSGSDKVPVALPYHMCDIYLDELELVLFEALEEQDEEAEEKEEEVDRDDPDYGEKKIGDLEAAKIAIASEANVRDLIQLFADLSQSAKLKTLREKIKEEVLDDSRLTEWGVLEQADGEKDGDDEDEDDDHDHEEEEEEWKGF
ncbi:uncharacterized protein LODBEIA_P32030 [Lodderomyces beijingensis]|uniref:Ribosomal RNA-processing protein 1 n=1 Tax=Lodderomyces beijingensis TaxID=1775926 RepID=A0ABP0ZLF7_9ASCO